LESFENLAPVFMQRCLYHSRAVDFWSSQP